MKVRKLMILRILVILTLTIGLKTPYVLASEFNFSVEPIQTETQVDKNQTYFDIQVKPGMTQELTIHMRNDTDEDVEIRPDIASATTNMNGVVEYSPNDIKADETLKYDLADLVKTEEKIIIPKKSSYDLKLKVTPPNEVFQGIIAGGITLREHLEDDEKVDRTSGLAIKNEYSYVVAIILHSEDQTAVEPELKMKNVYPSQVNARNVIMSDLQNPKPVYLNDVTILSEITKENQTEPLLKNEQNMMQIAPNTSFSYPTREEGRKLEAGKHTAKLTVYANKNEDGEHTYGKDEDGIPIRYDNKWEFTKEFTITKEKAKTLNKEDVTIQEDYTMWYIVGGLVLIIIGLLIWIILTKRKVNEK